MKSPLRPLSFAVAAFVVPLSGCELLQSFYQQDLEIPVPLETPPAELDATSQIEGVEQSLCSDEDSYNCVVVQALDYSDDENIGDPPSIPAEFPVEVTITNPDTGMDETVNAEEWAQETGLAEGIELAQAVPVDLTENELLKAYDPESVKAVSFQNVKLNWQENTFTFNTVPLDLYVSRAPLDDVSDAASLIASGTVQKVGTIPAQPAEAAGEVDVVFVDGGEDLFSDALKGMSFTIVVALPEDAQLGLNDGTPLDDGTATKRKPFGEAKVSLKAELTYTISAADVVEQVQGATE